MELIGGYLLTKKLMEKNKQNSYGNIFDQSRFQKTFLREMFDSSPSNLYFIPKSSGVSLQL